MTFTLSSPSFAEHTSIPSQFTCQGRNCSPKLTWRNPPEGTESFALIVDDPDAPDPKAPKIVWVHWIVYNIPKNIAELKEGITAHELPAGAKEGINDSHRTEYDGPCPPIGQHRYYFKLYALNQPLTNLHNPTKKELEKAMEGLILGKAELMGTYQKH